MDEWSTTIPRLRGAPPTRQNHRGPLTDFFDTATARKRGFQARSVVGGVFHPMLLDTALWQKWATR